MLFSLIECNKNIKNSEVIVVKNISCNLFVKILK